MGARGPEPRVDVSGRSDATGGWHDAGDYNKYVVNAGVTVGSMLLAWEMYRNRLEKVHLDIPESGGPLADVLAEVKWEMDWLLKMQAPDGSVYHKLSAINFCGFIMPDQEKEPRYFCPWSSAATADFAAMCAMFARTLKSWLQDVVGTSVTSPSPIPMGEGAGGEGQRSSDATRRPPNTAARDIEQAAYLDEP